MNETKYYFALALAEYKGSRVEMSRMLEIGKPNCSPVELYNDAVELFRKEAEQVFLEKAIGTVFKGHINKNNINIVIKAFNEV